MQTARDAFLKESGAALIRRHGNLGDDLFTPDGYHRYAEDLLERMTNPYLHDLTSRICRDHARKLGYDDRLFGTMRLALDYEVRPENLAMGAGAAVLSFIKTTADAGSSAPDLPRDASALAGERLGGILRRIWGPETDRHADTLIRMTWEGIGKL
jgi:mannitol-1-phosphate/altronate dehydrogenase